MSVNQPSEQTTMLNDSQSTHSSSKNPKSSSFISSVIAAVFVIIFGMTALYLYHESYNQNSNFFSELNSKYHSILPNYDLEIYELDQKTVSGNFIIQSITYQFISQIGEESSFTEFKAVNTKIK